MASSKARTQVRLQHLVLCFQNRLVKALAQVDNKEESQITLFLSHEDSLRLLNFRVWMLRWHQPISFMLQTLFDHYHEHRKIHRRGYRSIGIRLSTLMGERSEEVLEQRIFEMLPGGTEDQARSETKQRLLSSPTQTADGLKDLISSYRKNLQIRTREDQQTGKRYQRAWRGNPWL
jgi:hypothetical protein